MSRLKPRPTKNAQQLRKHRAQELEYKQVEAPCTILGEMFYQISWTTLPGLRGLACSEFRAEPTAAPDNLRGVAVECASEGERDALLTKLEAHFGSQRFMNTAAAFDSVKEFAISSANRK
jgi:hypothetical protein